MKDVTIHLDDGRSLVFAPRPRQRALAVIECALDGTANELCLLELAEPRELSAIVDTLARAAGRVADPPPRPHDGPQSPRDPLEAWPPVH